MREIGIIIALKEEYRTFSDWFGASITPARDEDTQCQYYEFDHQSSSVSYSCVATFAGEAGEGKAGRVAERMLAKYKPLTVVVLGIAAGIDKDVRLCDVVVATFVESYLDSSKAVSDGKGGFDFQLAGTPYETSHVLKDAIDHAEFAKPQEFAKWTTECATDLRSGHPHLDTAIEKLLTRKEPQSFCGPIASGPVVGACQEFIDFVKRHNRKFYALEMESGGVLGANREQPYPSKSLIIRGISDFGDDRKAELDRTHDGVFRKFAMRNAIRLFVSAMGLGIFPKHNQSTGPTVPASVSHVAPPTVIRDCVESIGTLRSESVSDIITHLQDHFGFNWEPGSFQAQPSVVFWPVRLRPPTLIHAAQAFAAAAIQKFGGHVILCLDDLGNREHSAGDFFSTVRRWCKRIHVNADFEEKLFSEMIGGDDPSIAWPIVRKWLGFTEQRMLEVLRISKILKADDSDNLTLKTLEQRRPRRLLTPAMIWTCLAQVMATYSDRAIITLGGDDERRLWAAWRGWIVEGKATVGHLYHPSLGVEPVHMSDVDLAWNSRTDIAKALAEDVRRFPQNWQHPNRMIPWCLSECVSLSAFVLSGCFRLQQFSLKMGADPNSIIPDLARTLEDRLLNHS